MIARVRAYFDARPEAKLAHSRAMNKKYRNEKNALTAKRARALKIEVIRAYGGKCVCCGETHLEFLTMDHIFGKKNSKIPKTGTAFYFWLKNHDFPKDEFRCLCMNCNFARGKFGYCPHENSRAVTQRSDDSKMPKHGADHTERFMSHGENGSPVSKNRRVWEN